MIASTGDGSQLFRAGSHISLGHVNMSENRSRFMVNNMKGKKLQRSTDFISVYLRLLNSMHPIPSYSD